MPVFHNFQLEPEFFMLLIIAPLMFIDGQKQSFANIRKRFRGIFLLSVVLAGVTAAVVGVMTKQIEARRLRWPQSSHQPMQSRSNQ